VFFVINAGKDTTLHAFYQKTVGRGFYFMKTGISPVKKRISETKIAGGKQRLFWSITSD
jgi:hypothetical protein